MERLHDELLSRCQDAAQTLISQASQKADLRSSPHADPDQRAVRELLLRQARSLRDSYDESRKNDLKPDTASPRPVGRRLEDVASITMSKFYCYRYDCVPDGWRHLYTDVVVLQVFYHLLSYERVSQLGARDIWAEVTEMLDRAVITAGGQSESLGSDWIEATLDMMRRGLAEERPAKRQKTSTTDLPDVFSTAEPYGRPVLTPERECPRYERWSLDRFEDYMNQTGAPKPIVFTDLVGDWPALTSNPWNSVDYLLNQTLGGRRLVPVEVGRSYVDQGWGQELIPFNSFLETYVLPHSDSEEQKDGPSSPPPVGYLAQHNLFAQIPSLRNDIRVPDFCWADVPRHPSDPSKDQATLDTPKLNAWFGPARTITPLHTDGYHNLLCQIVGTKYVRLYPPSATTAMRPRSVEDGVNMSNTSAVDVGVLEGWDKPGSDEEEEVLADLREEMAGVEYWECILGPGDTLLIPIGWWHYVRSLSVSFSVSFWWN